MRQWRLIYDAPMSGPANMAADEAIMHAVARGEQPPTLRVYAWEPFCLSLGYGQRVADADPERLVQHGWDIVRRPTGGRAILHGDELTYSVTLPETHPLAAGGIIETYLRLSKALLHAMGKLGLPVHADADGESSAHAGPVCFEVPSKYEITVSGKKLIGSAQLRRAGGVLQHGTIPLQGDIARICDALVYESEQARVDAKAYVRQRATTLAAEGFMVTWQQVAEVLAASFAEVLGVTFTVATLSDSERESAHQLYTSIYNTPDWTHKR